MASELIDPFDSPGGSAPVIPQMAVGLPSPDSVTDAGPDLVDPFDTAPRQEPPPPTVDGGGFPRPTTKPTPPLRFSDVVEGVNDAVNKGGTAVVQGVSDIGGMIGDVRDLSREGARYLANKARGLTGHEPVPADAKTSTTIIPRFLDFAPTSEDLQGLVFNGLGIPKVEAETSGGKILQQGLRGLVSGGVRGAAGLYGALSGAASEMAGQATEGTEAEPYARVAAGVGAPLIPMTSNAARRSPAKTIGKTVQGITAQQWNEADKLLKDAKALGIPLTADEALAQVIGKTTQLSTVRRVVEASPEGGTVMRDRLSGRPDQNRAAFQQTIDTVGPQVNAPTEVPHRVQKASEAAIDRARVETNKMSQPAYAATSNDPTVLVSPQGFQQISGDPVLMRAIKAVRGDSIKYGNLEGIPDQSMMVLDATKKYLDDLSSTAKQQGERFSIKNIENAQTRLLNVMDAEYPRYASARNIQSIRQRHVEEPLKREPIGQLAETGTVGDNALREQARILFPRDPATLTPPMVRKTILEMNKADPTAARDMARQFIESEFNRITRDLVQGQNGFGAAKFRAYLEGNPQQAENLRAAIETLPNGAGSWQGFKRLLETFEAQGHAPVAGSQTTFNQAITDELKGGKLAVKPLSKMQEVWDNFRFGKNTAQIAELLTDPDAVRRIRQLAVVKPNSNKARALAVEAIAIPRGINSSREQTGSQAP